MNKKLFNPIALLGFIGLLGIVGLITGNMIWYSWFCWFSWFARYKNPIDERFYKNITKSGFTCFFIALLGLALVVLLRGLNISSDIIFTTVGALFAVLLVSFTLLFEIFERLGA